MPPNSVFIFSPSGDHFLLQEEGVSIARTMSEVDIDFLVGETVVEIRQGNQVVFEAGPNPAPRLFARVEANVDCADHAGGPMPLSSLLGRSVASASARDGVLFLVCADGATLRCEPDPDYEAWQVEGGNPYPLIVCRPGGELSVWDETPPIPFGQLRERDPATAAALDNIFEQSNMPRPAAFPPSENKRGFPRFRRKG
jgi:hypothetical protein